MKLRKFEFIVHRERQRLVLGPAQEEDCRRHGPIISRLTPRACRAAEVMMKRTWSVLIKALWLETDQDVCGHRGRRGNFGLQWICCSQKTVLFAFIRVTSRLFFFFSFIERRECIKFEIISSNSFACSPTLSLLKRVRTLRLQSQKWNKVNASSKLHHITDAAFLLL